MYHSWHFVVSTLCQRRFFWIGCLHCLYSIWVYAFQYLNGFTFSWPIKTQVIQVWDWFITHAWSIQIKIFLSIPSDVLWISILDISSFSYWSCAWISYLITDVMNKQNHCYWVVEFVILCHHINAWAPIRPYGCIGKLDRWSGSFQLLWWTSSIHYWIESRGMILLILILRRSPWSYHMTQSNCGSCTSSRDIGLVKIKQIGVAEYDLFAALEFSQLTQHLNDTRALSHLH